MMDAARLRDPIGKRREGPLYHVEIPLMARFKGGNWEHKSPTGYRQRESFKVKG